MSLTLWIAPENGRTWGGSPDAKGLIRGLTAALTNSQDFYPVLLNVGC